MPSSNPTTGLGVAAYIQLAGTKITNPAGGSTVHPGGYANPINGQGLGANAGGVFPVAQYALTLSLSGGTGVYGSYDYGDPKSEAVAATLVDVQNNPVTISQYYRDNFVWEAYCAPAGRALLLGISRTMAASQASSTTPLSSPSELRTARMIRMSSSRPTLWGSASSSVSIPFMTTLWATTTGLTPLVRPRL